MLYLLGARSFGLLLRRKAPGLGLLDTTYDESYPVEVFSDSNCQNSTFGRFELR